jgi:hypothetical protein
LFRAALIPILIICSCVTVFGQSEPKKNIEIFEETISAALDKYYYYPEVNRNNTFIFIVNPLEEGGKNKSSDEASKFLRGIIKKTAARNNLKFSIAEDPSVIEDDSAYTLLILQIVDLGTKYSGFKKNRFLGDKTILRNIITDITVELKTSDGKVNLKDFINNTSQDEVNYDNYRQLESEDYDFTQGIPPDISAFERIIFPVLLICVTAAAAVIFFTIRTK